MPRCSLPSASASTSTMSRPCAMRAAAGIPIPLKAAEIAIAAGADGITAHLREDRRHIVDDDIAAAESAASRSRSISKWRRRREMIEIARTVAPARRLPRSRAAAGAHDRRRARCRRAARCVARRRCSRLAAAGIRVSLFIARRPGADRGGGGRSARRSSRFTPAPGATRWRRATVPPRPANSTASRAAQRSPRSAGLEVHAGHGLDFLTAERDRGAARNRRAQYRPFPDRRGDLRRPGRRRCARCARPWTAAACVAKGAAHDHRHRLRHHRRAPHRQGDRAPWRPLPRPHLHRRPNAPRPKSGGTGSRPTPSASPPRRRAPRRSAPGCVPASGGATWAWSICRRGGRRSQLTGGAKRRLEAITPAGYEARIDLTITDEGPMAHAFVVISAVPVARPVRPAGPAMLRPEALCRTALPRRHENFVMRSALELVKLMTLLGKRDWPSRCDKPRVQLRGVGPEATRSRRGDNCQPNGTIGR